MKPTYLIDALRLIDKPVCTKVADTLDTATVTSAGFDLHLRRADLNASDARILSKAMQQTNAVVQLSLKSFSASLNPELGDTGAAILAKAFPDSMTELGMVACSIGDAGGQAILQWAQNAPELRMLCIEQNQFSADMRAQLRQWAAHKPQIMVVV